MLWWINAAVAGYTAMAIISIEFTISQEAKWLFAPDGQDLAQSLSQ